MKQTWVAKLKNAHKNPRYRTALIALGLFVVVVAGALGTDVAPASATVGINSTVNFQGRLLNAAGAVVADGTYDMQFKIYQDGPGNVTGDTGGTLMWTESWIYGPGTGTGWTDNRVTVKNGYFSVPLGTICPMTATTCTGNSGNNGNAQTNTIVDFNQDTLWLSMNVGGTTQIATTANFTAAGDGEMLPMRRLASSVYALNAGKLGGLTSAGFIQNVSPSATQQAANINILSSAATNVAAAQIQTVASATAPVLILKGGATPGSGGDLLQVKDSTNTTLASIDKNGGLNEINASATNYFMGALGLATTNPQSAAISALTIANSKWISSVDSAGTGYVNMFQDNSSDQIQVGAALNVDGGIVLPTNGGQMTLVDLGIDSTASAATKESYTLRVGSSNALTVYGEADGSGNAQNVRVAVGSSITPAYTLDVGGDLNLSTGSSFRINGTPICTSSGCTTSGGSYINNQTGQQTANFNILSGAATTLPAAQIQTVASATAPVLLLKGGATPGTGGDLLQLQNNSAAVLFRVDSSGILGSADLTSASAGTTLRTGNSTTSGATGDLTLSTGIATSGNSGNIIINPGTASGTRGSITLGATTGAVANTINIGTNAVSGATNIIHIGDGITNPINTVTIGSKVSTSTTTIQAGTGGVNVNGATTVKGATADSSANTLVLQDSNSNSLLTMRNDGLFTVGTVASSGTQATFGNLSQTNTDSTDSNFFSSTKFTTGATAGTLSSISIWVGNIDSTVANRKYRLGIYTDTGINRPVTLLAQNEGTLTTALGFNTLAVSAALGANTTYWLAYDTNGASPSVNDFGYIVGATNQYYEVALPYGALPNTAASGGTNTALQMAIYGTYTLAGTGATTALSVNGSGNVGLGTSAPSYALDVQSGDVNTSGVYRIGGTTVCTSTGCTVDTTSVIQNQNALQQTATFNILSGAAVGVPAAKIQTVASATAPVLLLKGGATPGTGGDLLQLQNSVNAVLLRVDSSGILGSADVSTATTNSAGTTIRTGNSTTSGNTGDLMLSTGTPTSGTSGSVILKSGASSTTAVQIQNSAGQPLLLTDSTNTTNLITNSDFEASITGYGNILTGVATRNTTQSNSYSGNASLAIALGTTANSGTQVQASIISGGTQPINTYGLSFYAKGSAALTGLAASMSGGGTCTLNATTVSNTGFQRYFCVVTTTSATTSINITATTTSATLYIDNIQLQTTAVGAYDVGELHLTGPVASPLLLQNNADSTTEFQVQSNGGTALLTADSLNTTVYVGSQTADTTEILLQLDSYSNYTDAASAGCSATSNQGALYYNTNTNAIRSCVNANWEDVVTTAGLGIMLFGVVPDSGANPGDLASVTSTNITNGPCKVSIGAALTGVAWTGCTAYSGGRKVIVTAGTATATNGIAGQFQHLCISSTTGQPALTTAGAETANLNPKSLDPTSATTMSNPNLCLADIKFAAGNNTITGVYDVRAFTTSQKTYATAITNAPVLGQLVRTGTTTPGSVTATTAVADQNVEGVVVATTGATSTTAANVIVALSGPGYVKAITGTNVIGALLAPQATTIGYAITIAAPTSTFYGVLGSARSVWTGSTACAVSKDACENSILTDIRPR